MIRKVDYFSKMNKPVAALSRYIILVNNLVFFNCYILTGIVEIHNKKGMVYCKKNSLRNRHLVFHNG